MTLTSESQSDLRVRVYAYQTRLTYPAYSQQHDHLSSRADDQLKHLRADDVRRRPAASPNRRGPLHPPLNASIKAQGILGLLDTHEPSYRAFETLKKVEIQHMKDANTHRRRDDRLKQHSTPPAAKSSPSRRAEKQRPSQQPRKPTHGQHAKREPAKPTHLQVDTKAAIGAPPPRSSMPGIAAAANPTAAELATFQWPEEIDQSHIHPAFRTRGSDGSDPRSLESAVSPHKRPVSSPSDLGRGFQAPTPPSRPETFFLASDDEEDDEYDIEDDETVVGGEFDEEMAEPDSIMAQKQRMRPVLAPLDTQMAGMRASAARRTALLERDFDAAEHAPMVVGEAEGPGGGAEEEDEEEVPPYDDDDEELLVDGRPVLFEVAELEGDNSPWMEHEEAILQYLDPEGTVSETTVPSPPAAHTPPAVHTAPEIPSRSSWRPVGSPNSQYDDDQGRPRSAPKVKKATDGCLPTLQTIPESDSSSMLEHISTPELSPAEGSSPSSPSSFGEIREIVRPRAPEPGAMQPWPAPLQLPSLKVDQWRGEKPSRDSPHLTRDKGRRKRMTLGSSGSGDFRVHR